MLLDISNIRTLKVNGMSEVHKFGEVLLPVILIPLIVSERRQIQKAY
jgi:hypothetical protein